jgi:hypothetical protein
MEPCAKRTTYTSKIGDTTFIVNSSFTGTKTLADAFEEIILAAFRERCGAQPLCVRENNL